MDGDDDAGQWRRLAICLELKLELGLASWLVPTYLRSCRLYEQ